MLSSIVTNRWWFLLPRQHSASWEVGEFGMIMMTLGWLLWRACLGAMIISERIVGGSLLWVRLIGQSHSLMAEKLGENIRSTWWRKMGSAMEWQTTGVSKGVCFLLLWWMRESVVALSLLQEIVTTAVSWHESPWSHNDRVSYGSWRPIDCVRLRAIWS